MNVFAQFMSSGVSLVAMAIVTGCATSEYMTSPPKGVHAGGKRKVYHSGSQKVYHLMQS